MRICQPTFLTEEKVDWAEESIDYIGPGPFCIESIDTVPAQSRFATGHPQWVTISKIVGDRKRVYTARGWMFVEEISLNGNGRGQPQMLSGKWFMKV